MDSSEDFNICKYSFERYSKSIDSILKLTTARIQWDITAPMEETAGADRNKYICTQEIHRMRDFALGASEDIKKHVHIKKTCQVFPFGAIDSTHSES